MPNQLRKKIQSIKRYVRLELNDISITLKISKQWICYIINFEAIPYILSYELANEQEMPEDEDKIQIQRNVIPKFEQSKRGRKRQRARNSYHQINEHVLARAS